jgi:hypothetical protein
MKFIATTSDKIQDINIVSGQLIFSRDDRVIYLDTDVRTSFQQIITVIDEATRQALVSPVEGFYFVKETNILYHYQNNTWTQLTSAPDESLIFMDRKDFPTVGKEKTLYVDSKRIYQWDTESQDYIEMNSLVWDSIS